MKRHLFVAFLVSLTAVSLLAGGSLAGYGLHSDSTAPSPETMKLRVSGTTIALGAYSPTTPVPYIVMYQGVGTLGRFSGQGFLTYGPFVFNADKISFHLLQGSMSVVLESNGGTLLLILDNDQVEGSVQFNQDSTMTFEQKVTGSVAGGTGRFVGASGTFSVSIKGFGARTSGVMPWEGTFDITLD